MAQSRILVVDDEAAHLIAENLREAFEDDWDVEIEAETDSAKGLEKVLSNPPDLLILDYKMPVLDGDEVLRKIREARVKTRVMVLTAYASNPSVIYKFAKLGVCAIYGKRGADLAPDVKRVMALESPYSIYSGSPDAVLNEAIEEVAALTHEIEHLRRKNYILSAVEHELNLVRDYNKILQNAAAEDSTQIQTLQRKVRRHSREDLIIRILTVLTAAGTIVLFDRLRMVHHGTQAITAFLTLIVVLNLPFERVRRFIAKAKGIEAHAEFTVGQATGTATREEQNTKKLAGKTPPATRWFV